LKDKGKGPGESKDAERLGKAASPCPFWKNMSEKAPATGGPSPQLNLYIVFVSQTACQSGKSFIFFKTKV